MVVIIAAMSADRVIGSGSGMPWNVPDEYGQFLDWIRGQTVVMGRRSWEIFGADLTSRHNIVVTRSLREVPGATVAGSLDEALALARGHDRVVFVAGGAQVYRQALPLADRMYLSFIRGDFRGDTYFPEFEAGWREVRRLTHPDFDFVIYDRA